jgi:hypothetical protein
MLARAGHIIRCCLGVWFIHIFTFKQSRYSNAICPVRPTQTDFGSGGWPRTARTFSPGTKHVFCAPALLRRGQRWVRSSFKVGVSHQIKRRGRNDYSKKFKLRRNAIFPGVTRFKPDVLAIHVFNVPRSFFDSAR